MFTQLHDPVHLLMRKMEGIDGLSDSDRVALAKLPIRSITLGTDKDIVREGDRSLQSCILLQGLACSSKITGAGKRQIVAFHLPGDMPDLQSLTLGTIDTTITTMIPSKVGIILHEHLLGLFENRRLNAGFVRSLVLDAAVSREWVVNVGRRDALSSTAHLLSELSTRMHSIGAAADGNSFDLPITQQDLADALGLSIVHANRCLQVLRKKSLISWVGQTLTILDREGLEEIGDFTPDYLHMNRRALSPASLQTA